MVPEHPVCDGEDEDVVFEGPEVEVVVVCVGGRFGTAVTKARRATKTTKRMMCMVYISRKESMNKKVRE